MKRQSRILKIVGQPLTGFQQHILHDVARINPLRDLTVHPQLNHLAQRLAVPLQQEIDGGLLAPFGADQEFVSFRRIRPHEIIMCEIECDNNVGE